MKIRIISEKVDEIIDIPDIDITDTEKINSIVKDYLGGSCDFHWQVIEITAEEQLEWIQDMMRAHDG
ncbi:MAG: hypothetical protein Q8933_02300 [Bacteroidota bacterium]|nr:hypothetical protein [Bacteroidota bacterium]MDP4190149.1 hypothetical protein [Bacteroidota bacterium]MDP4193748.1 hypothetical protein [Bacteroidota bacterium]